MTAGGGGAVICATAGALCHSNSEAATKPNAWRNRVSNMLQFTADIPYVADPLRGLGLEWSGDVAYGQLRGCANGGHFNARGRKLQPRPSIDHHLRFFDADSAELAGEAIHFLDARQRANADAVERAAGNHAAFTHLHGLQRCSGSCR